MIYCMVIKVRLFLPLSLQWITGKGTNEKLFALLHEELIRDPSNSNLPVATCDLPFKVMVFLSLQGITSPSTSLSNKDSARVYSSRVTPIFNAYPDPTNKNNNYYITLESGEFSQDSKSAQKNIEIQCFLVDSDGNIRNSIKTRSTSIPKINESKGYNSTVYYHNNRPVYNETFFINIDDVGSEIYLSHILFLIFHCSSKRV